jgi:hypothetical protein
MIERTTVRLPSDLLDRARQKAASEGRTLTSVIEDGLRMVTAPAGGGGRKRILPRVSQAKGGMMPGYESLTHSQLEELDDLEYLERLDRQHREWADAQR